MMDLFILIILINKILTQNVRRRIKMRAKETIKILLLIFTGSIEILN